VGRLPALACEPSEILALDDHIAEERLRRRRLRPAASFVKPADPAAAAEKTPRKKDKGRNAGPEPLWARLDEEKVKTLLDAVAGSEKLAKESLAWLKGDATCIEELQPPSTAKAPLHTL